MPDIGRFFGVDPIASEYMSISTYQFAHNSPIWKIELEGLEGKPVPPGSIDVVNNEPLEVKSTTSAAGAAPVLGTVAEMKVVHKATEEVVKRTFLQSAGAVLRTVGVTIGAMLTPGKMGPGQAPQPSINPSNLPLPLSEPSSEPDSDNGVVLHRGVPRIIPTSHTGEENPAYPFALNGIAVPQDANGTSDPTEANKGVPSVYTFWSTDPDVAREFATDGDTTDGVILTKRFPSSVLENNPSPDKYSEGEVQIIGPVFGATPSIVVPKN